MQHILIYRTPANIEKIKELQQKADTVEELQKQINKLNEGMESITKFFDGLPIEVHKDGTIIKKGVLRTEVERKSKS